MAVRQHLYALQREHLVTAEERPVPLGRPAKYWQLTNDADRLFPDAYTELSVALIDAMDQALGPAGVQRVLASRSERQRNDYSARIQRSWPLERKLQELARIRTEEGYMAEVQPTMKEAFSSSRIIARSARRRRRVRGCAARNWSCFGPSWARASTSSVRRTSFPVTAAVPTA